jgi:histone arginine demethylase JMJD6
MSKRSVRGKHLVNGKEDDEPLDWFVNLLPRIRAKHPEVMEGMISFIQMPGETVFVPSNWWHTVLNLDDTIAVTQNFASTGNFSVVWRATREGRSKMARR